MSRMFKKAIVSIFAALLATIAAACDASGFCDDKVLLSLKYMAISYSSESVDLAFTEDIDYPNLISTYEVDRNHAISAEDLASIDSLTSFIPHNNGVITSGVCFIQTL